jgi:ATP-dependent protease ClpP protease subunit
MKAIINIQGVVGEEVTLLGVIRQYKGYKNPTEVEVIIDSQGGCVNTGLSIFKFLRNLELPITTKASRAYSIAASIFMAGDIRLLEAGQNRFMIHMPWGQMAGNSKDFEAVSGQLKDIEDNFTKFYSEYMSVDEDTVRRLLDNETFLSSKEATEMSIATGTYSSLKAVAYYNDELIKENEKSTIMTKTEKFLKAFAEFMGGSQEENPILKALVLQDANGEEISFPELDENETPEVGSKVDGREGEILMPDGSKVIVEDGEVKEIIPAPEEEDATDVDAEANADEVDYKAMLTEFKASILSEIKAENKEEKESLQAEIKALRKEIGSELDNEPVINNKSNSKNGNSLTNALRKRKAK